MIRLLALDINIYSLTNDSTTCFGCFVIVFFLNLKWKPLSHETKHINPNHTLNCNLHKHTLFFGLGLFITFDGWFVSGSYGRCLYLRLPVVSLRVPLKALWVDADGGTHSSTAATHSKHQARCIIEDDPQTLKWHKSNIFTIHFTVSILFCPLFALPLMDEQRWNKTNGLYDAIINRFVS